LNYERRVRSTLCQCLWDCR